MKPLIFDIQRFSIHDGPGIRTVVFFKGCNLECPWCQNPESIGLNPELAFYADRCDHCGACVPVCDQQALTLNGQLQIDRLACTACGKCADVCLTDALKVIGSEQATASVMREILRDCDYYQDSGGGVTFSGGEPTLHFDQLRELLLLCKAQGLHTNIETNGYFSWDKFEQLLPWLDLIYFDLKIMDAGKNKSLLGGDSERIIANMKKLVALRAPVEFRLPLIPGFTDNPENLAAIRQLLKACGIGKLHLLPYHSMGESKADKIDSPLPRLNLPPLQPGALNAVREHFEAQQITTIVYR